MRPPPLLAMLPLMLGCAGARPATLGVHDGRLSPCRSSPNCVSSDAPASDSHHIAPLAAPGDAASAWQAVRRAVDTLPRTAVITDEADYLHAECTSAFWGFVDDLELHHRPGEGVIAVRSASRLGHSDLGVNRKRVERLRAAFSADGAP